MAEPLTVGVTYLPTEAGVHMWQEPRPVRWRDDLERIRSQGFATARLHLAWDAFMPTHRGVDRHRIRELGDLLDTARGLGLRCELVLFVQSFGECVQLPRFAVDRARPRDGVRVLCDGAEVPGGPRDPWEDPLMLEVEELWLRRLLDAFANHPGVAGWDLGHDPATTVRPRRTAHLAAWAELFGGMVRRREDPVRMTLGAGDVLTARGVRLAAVTPHVDSVGLVIEPGRIVRLIELGGPDDAGVAASIFTLRLAERLAAVEDRPPALVVVTGLPVDDDPAAPPPVAPPRVRPGTTSPPPSWDVVPLIPPEAARRTGELLGRLREAGAAGLVATAWTLGGPRTLLAPPWDRRPSLARHGLTDPGGELREHGAVWSAVARREPEVQASAPWPDRIDVESYYAELPGSARDLFARFVADEAGGEQER